MIFHTERVHSVAEVFFFFSVCPNETTHEYWLMNTNALRQECRSGRKTKSSGALLLQEVDL